MVAVEVANRAGLAEMLDAERLDAVAADAAEPAERGRMAVEHGDDAAVARQRRQQLFDMAEVLHAAPVAAQKIKVSTDSVPVYVTVTDTEKRLVPDLAQEDFEILDNTKVQNVNVFENKPTPITVMSRIEGQRRVVRRRIGAAVLFAHDWVPTGRTRQRANHATPPL